MCKLSRRKQTVVVDHNSTVGGITQNIFESAPTALIVAVVVIAVAVVIIAVIQASGHNPSPSVEFPPTPTVTAFDQAMAEGQKSFRDGKDNEAEERFSEASEKNPQSPEPWYWKAKISEAKNKTDIALEYIDEAIKRAPNHQPSLVLEIRLLLLTGGDSTARAQEKANQISSKSDDLNQWLECLNRESLFTGIITASDLDKKCPSPAYR